MKTNFNEKRKLNYNKLRSAGFHYLDATKYKDHDDDTINKMIESLPFPILSTVVFLDNEKGRVIGYKNGNIMIDLYFEGTLLLPIEKAKTFLKVDTQ